MQICMYVCTRYNSSTAIGTEIEIGQEGVTVTPNQCGQGMSVVEQSYLFQVLKAKSVMQIRGNTDYLIQDFDTEKQMLKPLGDVWKWNLHLPRDLVIVPCCWSVFRSTYMLSSDCLDIFIIG